MTTNNINSELSHSISQLRFPLAVLVVFGHANILSFPIKGLFSEFSVIQYPILLFSKIIFDPAVPLFFLISGILFFWNVKIYDKSTYRSKIKKRIKSLLLPYLVWNIIYDIPQLSKGFFDCIRYGGGYDGLITIFKSLVNLWFWTNQIDRLPNFEMTTPIDPPLWFVRDLFVCMLSTMLIYHALNKKKTCGITLFILLCWWLTGKYQYLFPGISVPSFLFFGIGSAIGIHKIDIIKISKKYEKMILGIFFVLFLSMVFSCYYIQGVEKPLLQENKNLASTYILFSIPAYLLIACKVVKYRCLNLEGLAAASFTLFACHWLVLYVLKRIFGHLIKGWIGEGEMMLIQLVLFIVPCLTGIFIYHVIKQSDKAKLLFNGGR